MNYPARISVVDSRSTDGTLNIIRYRLQHANIRFIERDRGLSESWNEGVAATSGDWIYISTAGDTSVWHTRPFSPTHLWKWVCLSMSCLRERGRLREQQRLIFKDFLPDSCYLPVPR